MVGEFQQQTGIQVITSWMPTVEIIEHIEKGEAGDLVILSGNNIDDLIGKGFLLANSRSNYVSSGIGIGIRKNTPKPPITSEEDFKQTLMNANSIGYSTGPSGVYLKNLFHKMGIAEQIESKIRIVQGEPVGKVVLRGDAEIGLQQIPEILSVPEIEYLGPLPPALQSITTFAFAIPSNKSKTKAVELWMNTLKSPIAEPIIRRFGLKPCE
jgi:molybdate transport system substrate-binding protein